LLDEYTNIKHVMLSTSPGPAQGLAARAATGTVSRDRRPARPTDGGSTAALRHAESSRRRGDESSARRLELSPQLTGLIAAEVFIVGFMLAGTTGDFKEAECLPGELAASLEIVADGA